MYSDVLRAVVGPSHRVGACQARMTVERSLVGGTEEYSRQVDVSLQSGKVYHACSYRKVHQVRRPLSSHFHHDTDLRLEKGLPPNLSAGMVVAFKLSIFGNYTPPRRASICTMIPSSV